MNRREFLKIGSMGMMAVALAGCGFSAPAGNISGQAAGSAGSRAGTAGEAAKSGSKTLVVYYSATGRTERVAKVIAKERQADIVKLVPSPDYTEADLDYNNTTSRVSREHDDAVLREKVKANDFTGKHVVTFATAYSSPLGNSGKLLSEMAGGKGQWQDGICFTGSLSEDKVREWVKSLE